MKRVLVVDDELINRKLTISYLLNIGYDQNYIEEAEDGEEALNILKNKKIDYILLDIYMPKMSGLELLDIIKSDKSLKDIPIIVLTTDDKLREDILKRGVNKFVVRPIDFNEFIKSISEFVIE
jgi:CheY-like chemotaxis protein